ncbi:hypothetical protein [Longimicrobium sp.]|uniref:hypothetical protein n=1 Tax=Longimicrobium sp. TaxID=2029185 RepID=UPI002F926FDC
MARSAILPLVLLCACAPQATSVPVGPERMSTVIIETPEGSAEVRMVAARPHAHSSVVLVPVDQAWAALPGVYEGLGLSGAGIVDPGQRRFGMGPATMPRRVNGERLARFLDCGHTVSMPNADAYAVTVTMITQLNAEAPAATRVQTVLEATARPRDTAGNEVTCTSTGHLERLIASRLHPAPR